MTPPPEGRELTAGAVRVAHGRVAAAQSVEGAIGSRSRREESSKGGPFRSGPKGPICIIASCGGHLTEARSLRPIYGRYEHFYVINEPIRLPPDMEGRTQFVVHAERDWRVLINFWEAWRILRRRRPALILSTGAGTVVPFALVGKLLGIPTTYIESASRTGPSLTGRLMYRIADRFFYQWKTQGRHFPRATYGGLLP